MRTTWIVLALVLVGFLAPRAIQNVRTSSRLTTTAPSAQSVETVPPSNPLYEDSEIKLDGKLKTLTLEARNTVVIRGPVTVDSVSKAMLELTKISRNVPKSTPIFLVLDTPGGSVMDGLDLIDFANALPQKVNTVTLFAASMGFQIAQNLDRRYITRSGILMSHRATLGGLGGQMKGELESRYKMLRRSIDYLDFQAAKRMQMEVKAYEAMIVNEYWVHGFDAVSQKAADEEVLLSCGPSMSGTETLQFETIFGEISATVSKCPLVKGLIKVDASGLFNKRDKERATEILLMSFQNQREFVREYISTGKFAEIFN